MEDPPKFCLGRRKRGQYCIAVWCNNFFGCRIDEPISFFSFPKELPRAKTWLKFALREDLMSRDLSNLRLCSDHFLDKDYRCKRPRILLKPDAIPSQYERHLSVTNGQIVNATPKVVHNSQAHPGLIVTTDTTNCQMSSDEGEEIAAFVHPVTSDMVGSLNKMYHFEETQYENRRVDGWKKLRPNAVPTIFDIPKPPRKNARRAPCKKKIIQDEGVKLPEINLLKEVAATEDANSGRGMVVVMQPQEILPSDEVNNNIERNQEDAVNPFEEEVKALHLKVYQLQKELHEANQEIKHYKELLSKVHSTEQGSTQTVGKK